MQNTQFSIAKFVGNKQPTILALSLLMLLNTNVANAENPYQQALKLQRQMEQDQRQPVGPLGITPQQLEIQRSLELESQIQQQKMRNLQYQINELKRQRESEDQDLYE